MKNTVSVILLHFVLNGIVLSQGLKSPVLYRSMEGQGTTIFKEHSFMSQEMGEIEFGATVTLLEDSIKNDIKKYHDSLELKGRWMKIKSDAIIGYVMNADFTSKNILKSTQMVQAP